MSTLALIPARGGSKGIPRKNIRPLAGKPLIAWTIEAALAADGIERVVVTTDDEEIAEIAREWGAEIPFMRPAELASDEAPGIAPVLHAIDALDGFDELLLLQPTSPLRTTRDIEAIQRFAAEREANSVVSVTEVSEHPALMMHRDDKGLLSPFAQFEKATRRQDLPPLFRLNGALYWVRVDWLRQSGALVNEETLGFVMDAQDSVDLDTMLDWRLAETLLNAGPRDSGRT